MPRPSSLLKCLLWVNFYVCIYRLYSVPCRAVSRQRLDEHVPIATDTHATTEVLLETVFCIRLVQMGYKEDN
jgi:hypothetical protein